MFHALFPRKLLKGVFHQNREVTQEGGILKAKGEPTQDRRKVKRILPPQMIGKGESQDEIFGSVAEDHQS